MIRPNKFSLLILSAMVLGACSKKADGTVDSATAAVAAVDSTAPAAAVAREEAAAASSTASTATIVPININTASDAEILKIPGVGKKMLREFKEYRPWTSVAQFRREIGKYVDKAEVARLEQYIVIK